MRFIVVILYRGFKLLHAQVVPTEDVNKGLDRLDSDPATKVEASFCENARNKGENGAGKGQKPGLFSPPPFDVKIALCCLFMKTDRKMRTSFKIFQTLLEILGFF